MRIGLGSGSGEMFDLFAQAGENALEVAETVERALPRVARRRRHAGGGQGARARGRPASSLRSSARSNSQFVTPYDREDIVALAFAVDEVPDKIESAAELLGLYGVEAPTRQSLELCALLVRATERARDAARALKGMHGSAPEIRVIKEIEDEADDIARAARGGLFKDDRIDPVLVIRWKESTRRSRRRSTRARPPHPRRQHARQERLARSGTGCEASVNSRNSPVTR